MENKIFRTVLVILGVILAIGVCFAAVRFMPPLLKLLGVIGNVATIWFLVKYIKKEYFNKKKEDNDTEI